MMMQFSLGLGRIDKVEARQNWGEAEAEAEAESSILSAFVMIIYYYLICLQKYELFFKACTFDGFNGFKA